MRETNIKNCFSFPGLNNLQLREASESSSPWKAVKWSSSSSPSISDTRKSDLNVSKILQTVRVGAFQLRSWKSDSVDQSRLFGANLGVKSCASSIKHKIEKSRFEEMCRDMWTQLIWANLGQIQMSIDHPNQPRTNQTLLPTPSVNLICDQNLRIFVRAHIFVRIRFVVGLSQCNSTLLGKQWVCLWKKQNPPWRFFLKGG